MNVRTLLRLTVTTALVTGAAALGGAWASAQGLEFEQVATITGPAEPRGGPRRRALHHQPHGLQCVRHL